MEKQLEMYKDKLSPTEKEKSQVWDKVSEQSNMAGAGSNSKTKDSLLNQANQDPVKSNNFPNRKLILGGLFSVLFVLILGIIPVSVLLVKSINDSNQAGGIPGKLEANAAGETMLRADSCAQLEAQFEEYRSAQDDLVFMEDGVDMAQPNVSRESNKSTTSSQAEAGGYGSGGPEYYTSTNVQVEGIDEADVLKTNGKALFTIDSKRNLVNVLAIYPFADAEKKSEIKFSENESPIEMLLFDKQLIVFTRVNNYMIPGNPGPISEEEIDDIKKPQGPMVRINVFDIGDLSSPKKIREIDIEGNYNTSRLKGNDLYLITNKSIWGDGPIIPLLKDSAVSEQYENSCNCSDVAILDENYIYPQFTSILTLDINSTKSQTSVYNFVGDATTVYMSYENIYFASPQYGGGGVLEIDGPGSTTTVLNKVSYKDQSLKYVGSAEFRGTLLNQFSLDESDGYLRLAGTIGDVWNSEDKSENYLLTFDEDLKQAGEIRDLARGERIYSARFYGDIGVIVTFKKVDPLFVFDLGEPEKPVLKGELKIPGYSDYLHFIDENTIIGLGKDTVEADEELQENRGIEFAWYQGIKMAIFDISDVNNPLERSKLILGERGTDSEALHNHKAFVYDRKHNLILIPALITKVNKEECEERYSTLSGRQMDINSCYGTPISQGTQVIEIDQDNQLKLSGEITHFSEEQLTKAGNSGSDRYYGSGSISNYADEAIKRNLVIEDEIITLSNKYAQISDIDGLKLIKEIELQETKNSDDSPIVLE